MLDQKVLNKKKIIIGSANFGLNYSYLNYYKKWEKDFLFKGDGVSPPVFSAYRNIEGEQMKRISGQDKFNVEVPDAGQQLIINNLISPYRHLKSLTNSKWEGTRKQKIELDELIAGVRAYDSELQWANVRAQKEAGEQNYGVAYNNKDIFNGWNYEARIFGKTTFFIISHLHQLCPTYTKSYFLFILCLILLLHS